MKNLLLLTILFLSSFTLSAQSFEGTVKMHQITANGIEYDVTWYIKKDKIAVEVASESARGMQMRFIPLKGKKAMLMVTGDTKKEIPVSQITSDFSFDNLKTKEDKSQVSGFTNVTRYNISNAQINAEVQVTTDIDIQFSEYADFFKNDCGLYLLASSNKKGFPINSTVKDAKGNLIVKTTFKSMTRKSIEDSKFQ